MPGAQLPDDVFAQRGMAVLRLALVPIVLAGLPGNRLDSALDVWPVVLAGYAVYAIVLAVLAFGTDRSVPWPLQAGLDLVSVGVLIYVSGGVRSPVRFAFYVLPILAALRLSPRLAAVWTLAAIAAFIAVTLPHPGGAGDDTLVVDESLALLWVGAVATGVAVLLARRDARLTALVRQSLDAEARERRRLAQALHDGALQNVLLARQEVGDLERGVPDAADRARTALDAAQHELRAEVASMHPVGVERVGIEAVLREAAAIAARRAGFAVEVTVRPELSGVHDELLGWAARELLTNAAKHSRARRVAVTLTEEDDALRLTVADDGVGFAAERLQEAVAGGHIGIAAVRERLAAVGGSLQVESAPGGPTSFTVRVPW